MGQIQYTIALVMLSLFGIAVLGFAIGFAEDNNAFVDISQDTQLTGLKTSADSNVNNFRDGSEGTYRSIIDSSVQDGDSTTTKGGTFAITHDSALSSVKNIIEVGYIRIFGSGNGFGIFLTALISLIGFVFALYLWKTWVGRTPD